MHVLDRLWIPISLLPHQSDLEHVPGMVPFKADPSARI